MPVTRDHVEQILADADELLVEIVNRHTSPGLAIGVVHDGELVYAKGLGFADVESKRPVTTDTVFRIGSTSKTLTAIGLMQLWEQGRLDLDDPVVGHLRSYRFEQPEGTRPVTIRDMFTHTSGVGEVRGLTDLRLRGAGLAAPEGEPIPSLKQWYARGLRAEVGPGQKWAYANHAIATLGQLIEDISGQPFEEYMLEHVLEPLGMLGSDFLRSQRVRDRLAVGYKRKRGRFEPVRYLDIVVAAAGSMFSSIDDMARYLTALMS
ncbi:MAG TPA: serine hydrolase domain-containing protein, partial [Nitriliruptorales bacterium]